MSDDAKEAERFYSQVYKEQKLLNKFKPSDEFALGVFNNSKNPIKIIDIGCGMGHFLTSLKNLRKNAQDEYHGTDVANEGLKIAKSKGIKTKKADLNNKLPYRDNYFDFVYCSETIEHIYDTDNLVLEIRRILKPTGLVIFTTPNLASWYNRIFLLLGIHPFFSEISTKDKTFGKAIFKKIIPDKWAAGHIRNFTIPAFNDLLRYHGYRVVKNKTFTLMEIPKTIRWFDRIMSRINLGSDIMVIARKKEDIKSNQ
ncbi:MAG: class I SAM-dependent methyltransferase [archaeon]